MSSYHTSFTYKGISSVEKGLVIAAFDPQVGETSAFLNMEPLYEENITTGIRYDYGAKYNEVATINVTLVTFDGSDFTVDKFRDVARWLSGAKKSSWLDLYSNDKVAYSFFCKCTDIKQYKMDSRTIGVTATFTSNSPWAYSAEEKIVQDIFSTADSGIPISITNMSDEGYAYTYPNIVFQDARLVKLAVLPDNSLYRISDYSVIKEPIEWVKIKRYVDETLTEILVSPSNYKYIDADRIEITPSEEFDGVKHGYDIVELKCASSTGGNSLSICNDTTRETTVVRNLDPNEIITINSNQIIYSDNKSRVFGDDFNFVWPKLVSGTNVLSVVGQGKITITYRYPIKVGDCVINLDTNMSCDMCHEASQALASDSDVYNMFTDVYNDVFEVIE